MVVLCYGTTTLNENSIVKEMLLYDRVSAQCLVMGKLFFSPDMCYRMKLNVLPDGNRANRWLFVSEGSEVM